MPARAQYELANTLGLSAGFSRHRPTSDAERLSELAGAWLLCSSTTSGGYFGGSIEPQPIDCLQCHCTNRVHIGRCPMNCGGGK